MMDPWLSVEAAASEKSSQSPNSNNNNSEFEDHFTDIIPIPNIVTSAPSSTTTTNCDISDNTNSIPAPISTTNEGTIGGTNTNISGSDISSKTTLNSNTELTGFEKLADSKDYLASLEKKLKTIQSGTQKKNLSSKPEARLIQSLEETRESYMVNFLQDSSTTTTDFSTEFPDDLIVNPILKLIAPEKQAISSEELIELLKADQLLEQTQNLAPEETTEEPAIEIETPDDDSTKP